MDRRGGRRLRVEDWRVIIKDRDRWRSVVMAAKTLKVDRPKEEEEQQQMINVMNYEEFKLMTHSKCRLEL
jgi:hypothetical protein